MRIDVEARRPALGWGSGGLSGPALRPIALRMVYQVASALPGVPIIGCGGVMSGDDAVEFLMAGASAVQVGTATFLNPRAPLDVIEGLEAVMRSRRHRRRPRNHRRRAAPKFRKRAACRSWASLLNSYALESRHAPRRLRRRYHLLTPPKPSGGDIPASESRDTGARRKRYAISHHIHTSGAGGGSGSG